MIQMEQQEKGVQQKKKIRNLIENLENHLRLDEKIINLKQQLDKLSLQITTSSDQDSVKEKMKQLEVAIFNYEEEKKIWNYNDEEKKKLLDSFKNIIQQIKPLELSYENQRQIHKDLKNLNRFEEHFLILRVKSNDEEFIMQASKILSMVCDKKNEIKSGINQSKEKIHQEDQQNRIQQQGKDELKIVKQDEKIMMQETPTQEGITEEQLISQQQSKNLITKQEQNQQSDQLCETEKCQICFANKRKFVAIPCGHYIYCQSCKELVLQKLKCLLCRQNVLKMFEIFS
ncbi:unnamed protein product [Paramecium sonneborni]|uniref:RING-type domain-containing protein n=1 Tax=Paramecium sonneborni TaxID=65129 RepID=A0A8S1R5X6_9CILI|nr:unnamed protein product [Paramecium sonneborni]